MPEAYGQIPQLRAALEARGAGCAMAVACSTWVWINHGRTSLRADTVVGRLLVTDLRPPLRRFTRG
ncbi:hypothetical protein [Streptomyces mirabilis]